MKRACISMLAAATAAFAACADQMTTKWGESVTSENAWRGYPRPQMVRDGWTNLNGDWV